MRGRKPKPTYLRVLDGGAGRRPRKLHEPQPTGDLTAEPPEHLSDSQQAIWRAGIASCPPGMLKRLDSSVFLVWVIATDTLERARREVVRTGLVIRVNGQPMRNPFLGIQEKQSAIVMKAASELGFSPTSRPRVNAPHSVGDPDNPFADLPELDG